MALTRLKTSSIGNNAITSEKLANSITLSGNISANNIALNNMTVSGNIVPTNNETFDIGNSTNRFRDVYLSGNTIDLGGAKIKMDDVLGLVAIVPKVTAENPNPSALIITAEGKTTVANTVAGNVNFSNVQTQLETNPGFGGALKDLSTVENSPGEILDFTLDGHGTGASGSWSWSWLGTGNPYNRTQTTNTLDPMMTLHKKGSYTFTNKASNLSTTEVVGATHVHNAFLKWIPGAGNNNLVTGVTYSNVSINGNTVQKLTWNVPHDFSSDNVTLTPPNVSITFEAMGSHGGNGSPHWHVDESHAFNDTVIVYRGGTYTFQVVGEAGHPLYLTTDSGNNFVSGQYVSEYTNGVTNSRATANTNLTWTVANNAPNTLYYQCGNHSTMKGTIEVKNLALNLGANGLPNVYLQHMKNGMFNTIQIAPAIEADLPMSFLWKDTVTGKWIPKNFIDYANTTSEFQNWVANAADARIANNKPVLERHFNKSGNLTVSVGTKKWYAPSNLSINNITARVETAPTGSSASFVVKRNGTNIANLTIPQGNTVSAAYTTPISINNNDSITVDVTAIGSNVAGADLTVTFLYTRN